MLGQLITNQYLDSSDFNGVSAAQLVDALEDFPADVEELITELVAEGLVYANFGHEMVNATSSDSRTRMRSPTMRRFFGEAASPRLFSTRLAKL